MVNGRQEVCQKSLEIKQDDKFFTRIMSKETSMANSSCRVYYGVASGSIPFTWESRPGTPKHTFSDTSIPPLTPPPSYYSTSKKSKSRSMRKRLTPSNLFNTVFPTLNNKKTSHVSPSSSMSSTATSKSSPSWSSFQSFSSSPSALKTSKLRNNPCFLCSRLPIHYRVDGEEDEDEDEHVNGSPTSTLCYHKGNKNLNVFGGRYLMENMKNALLSVVRHGSN